MRMKRCQYATELVFMKKVVLIFVSVFLMFDVFAQHAKREMSITRISEPPKIDGVIFDSIWNVVPVVSDFIQYEPLNGAKPSFKTEVQIAYDDDAVYVAAKMFDPEPDKIKANLGERDSWQSTNSDLFTIFINPFNDGINAVEFMVSASGVQSDGKHSGNNGDPNWDAVWESEVKLTDFGWSLEMKIPYAALRIPKMDSQVWGMHFFRFIQRFREWSSWTYVDIKSNGIVHQTGLVNGIKDVKHPMRLSLTPYTSAYLEHNTVRGWGTDFNVGMDLKFGINESFTLDMTLIPDFGQVQADDKVLNLSPYEVNYGEKRQFFMEGTELFGKGGIFYSRRIDHTPKNYYSVGDSISGTRDTLLSNPSTTGLINATKISGRTSKGLGIGVFNAFTGAAYAQVQDSVTGEIRKIRTQGFTNYNMLVFDQNLPNNSSISFANTRMNQYQDEYLAQVSAIDLNLKNKANSYSFFGRAAMSQLYDKSLKPDLGYMYFVELEKSKGNFRWELWQSVESDTYNPNDMGFLQANNEFNTGADVSYSVYEPIWKLRSMHSSFDFSVNYLYAPREFTSMNLYYSLRGTFEDSQLSFGYSSFMNPVDGYDYFEPRIWGWKYRDPAAYELGGWISSDYRKTFALDLRLYYSAKSKHSERNVINYTISPRIRLNSKMLMIYSFNQRSQKNDYGFVTYADMGDNTYQISFGNRSVETITNQFELKYTFTNKMALNFRLRHYWSQVDYYDFHVLQSDGSLGEALGYETYSDKYNFNYNAFNINLNFVWHFAPGSDLSVVWKNSIETNHNEAAENYFSNLRNTLDSDQVNSFSIKMIYYLDYQYIKKLF